MNVHLIQISPRRTKATSGRFSTYYQQEKMESVWQHGRTTRSPIFEVRKTDEAALPQPEL
jgi:hypothetical protein